MKKDVSRLLPMLFLSAIVAFYTPSLADEKKAASCNLDEMVVTATRTNRDIMDIPVSTTVLTAEEIKAHGIVNLDEALKYATGVWNRRTRGMADVGASISIRGISGGERSLIMIDNQPINSVVWGGVPWSGINIDQVDRIEVVRGPFSALYGVNAMGGVVNIITKRADKETVSVETGYGSDQTTIARVNYGNRFNDKYSLNFGAERKSTEGYPTFIQTKGGTAAETPADGTVVSPPGTTTDVTGKTTRYIVGDTGKNPTTDWNVFLKGAVDFSPGHRLSLHYTHSEQSDEWKRPHSYLTDTQGRSVYSGTVYFQDQSLSVKQADYVGWIFGGRDNDILAANYENELTSRFKLKVDTGFNYQFRYYTIPDVWWPAKALISGGPGTYYEYPSTVFNLTASSEIQIWKDLVGTVGISYRHDHGEQDVWSLTEWNDDHSKTHKTTHIEGDNDYYSLFAQAEWRLFDKMSIIPALRYDIWQTSGKTEINGIDPEKFNTKDDAMISPKLSIGYRPMKNLSVRASVGLGYKPPDIDKLYRILPAASQDEEPVYPNRDLDPEKVFSWEAGLDYRFCDQKARFSATYYENRISNSLFQLTDSTGTRWHSGAESIIKGVEAGLKASLHPSVNLFGNVTLQDSEVTRNKANPALVGKELVNTPKLMWNVGFDVTYWRFTLVTAVSHVDKAYGREDNSDTADNVPTGQSGYTVVDLDLHYQVSDRLKASLSVDNLFDKDYYLYWKAAGRTIMASVRYDF